MKTVVADTECIEKFYFWKWVKNFSWISPSKKSIFK